MIKTDKIYPKIEVDINRFIPLNSSGVSPQISFWLDESTQINISNSVTIYPIDKNINVKNNILYPQAEGSGIVKFIYTYNEKTYIKKMDFIVYSSFFKDNYEMHYIPELDRINLQSNTFLKITFDTLFEFYDILYAYHNNVDDILNPLKIKSNYLNALFYESGLPLIDFEHENTEYEEFALKMYRNLLNKILDIFEIRATLTSYELFFGALGYDIELYEFWFDENENLVEVNPTSIADSTFVKYDIYGMRLNEDDQDYNDPRIDYVHGNNMYKNNKSNFIRVKYTKNDNLPEGFEKSKTILKKYLEFLRPNHLRYITEMFALDSFTDEIVLPTDEVLANPITIWDDIETEFEIISDGKILNAIGEASVSLSKYFIESDGQVLIAKNSAIISYNGIDVYSFESIGDILLAKNSAEYEYEEYIPEPYEEWDPLTGDYVIYWYKYISQASKDNFVTGFKKGIPADFFSIDFTGEGNDTYHETIRITKEILLEDIVEDVLKFDTGWSFDEGIYYDTTIFLNSESQNVVFNKFTSNELEGLYADIENNNPTYTEEEIKAIILEQYSDINDGEGLHPEILDQLLGF